jgi:transcriptional regulator with XRE-family HTH domain
VLKATRESVALSLREVEKRTGISNAYLSQLENGRNINPSPHVLAKLSRVYGLGYSDLMAAAGYSEGTIPGNPQFRVAMLASELNGEEQKEVEGYIRLLLARRAREQR